VYPPPAGGGGLPGLGGWADITAVTGSPTKHEYTDADGKDWTAYEWAGDGGVTVTEGLVDSLLVGGGGYGFYQTAPGSQGAGNGGGVLAGIAKVSAGTHTVEVGAAGTEAVRHGGRTTAGFHPIPVAGGAEKGGSGAVGDATDFAGQPKVVGGVGFKSSIAGGVEKEYGRGGFRSAFQTGGYTGPSGYLTAAQMPPSAGTHGWGGGGACAMGAGAAELAPTQPPTGGCVIIRVPRANAKA
jgi:hypothetical protein